MDSFDPKKLRLLNCALIDQQLSTPLLTFIDPAAQTFGFDLSRGIVINEEHGGVMLFLFVSLVVDDAEGEELASCHASYRCTFAYDDTADLFGAETQVSTESEHGPAVRPLSFNAAATLHSVAFSTVRGMFLMHLAHTPLAGAILPIFTINELLAADLVVVE